MARRTIDLDTPLQPNHTPSREEYLALFDAMETCRDLLDILGRRASTGGILDEYRAASHAIARARVEVQNTAKAADDDPAE